MAKVQRTCQLCGQEFWVLESWLAWRAGRGKFCSKQCAKQHQQQQSERIVVCLECGEEFKTQQHFINRGEAKFCSQSCAAIYNNRIRSESPSKEELERMYLEEKRSMQEIADQLDCSAHKVGHWLDRYGIKRRSGSEATYLKRNPNGDPFRIKELETEDDRELFTLAMGLYLGEGTKSKRDIRLGNSDPKIIRAFLRFLREICGVEEKRIFAWLNIYDDVDLEKALCYWMQVTNLPRNQFYKTTVRPGRGGTYNNKSEYGTLTVGISNVKLTSKVTEWYKNAIEKFGS